VGCTIVLQHKNTCGLRRRLARLLVRATRSLHPLQVDLLQLCLPLSLGLRTMVSASRKDIAAR
jgi:hypothetical protein